MILKKNLRLSDLALIQELKIFLLYKANNYLWQHLSILANVRYSFNILVKFFVIKQTIFPIVKSHFKQSEMNITHHMLTNTFIQIFQALSSLE
jgi:hypothetical protein